MNQFKENEIVIMDDYNLAEVKTVIKEYAANPKYEKIEKKIKAYRKAISFENMKYVNSRMENVWGDTYLHKCRYILKLLERDLEKTKPQIPVYFYEIYYGADHQVMTVAETVLFKIKNKQCFEVKRKSYGEKDK